MGFSLLFGVTHAQSTIDPICQVYGSIQGVFYDSFKKACSSSSSSEACNELLQTLHSEFNAATLSRPAYAEANIEGCKIVLRTIEEGIYFSIEGGASILAEAKKTTH